MALGLTQPLTEMSTRNLPGGKQWPACKVDNLPSSMGLPSRKCGSLDVSQSYRPPRPPTRTALLRKINDKKFSALSSSSWLLEDALSVGG
jgi:hypothetical protein